MLLMLLELAPQGVRLSAHVKFMEQNVFCQRYVALIYLEILKKLVSYALFFLDAGGKGCGVQIWPFLFINCISLSAQALDSPSSKPLIPIILSFY